MIRESWLRRLVFRSSLSLHSFVFLGDLRALVVTSQPLRGSTTRRSVPPPATPLSLRQDRYHRAQEAVFPASGEGRQATRAADAVYAKTRGTPRKAALTPFSRWLPPVGGTPNSQKLVVSARLTYNFLVTGRPPGDSGNSALRCQSSPPRDPARQAKHA
jgi:hypothetical protein